MTEQPKCSVCGRPLQAGEDEACPACDAEGGRVLGNLGKGLLILGTLVVAGWKILTGRKSST